MNKPGLTKYLLTFFMVSVGFSPAIMGQDTSKKVNQKSYSEKMNRSYLGGDFNYRGADKR